MSQQSIKSRTSSGKVRHRSGMRCKNWISEIYPDTYRRLQAKLEAENEESRAIIQPILDTQKELDKEVEVFLVPWDIGQQRKRQLLHKRWTDHVWTPIQQKLEEHVSRCHRQERGRRQGLYDTFIDYCNVKDQVFLETYNPQEYNPFQLNVHKTHQVKLNSLPSKDPLFLYSCIRTEEMDTVVFCKTGRKRTRRQGEGLFHDNKPHLMPAPHSSHGTPRPDRSLHFAILAPPPERTLVQRHQSKSDGYKTYRHRCNAMTFPEIRYRRTKEDKE